MRHWKKWCATAAVAALTTMGLVFPSQAAGSQDIGSVTDRATAMEAYATIEANALQYGQDAGKPSEVCPGPAAISSDVKLNLLKAANAYRTLAHLKSLSLISATDPGWTKSQEAAITIARTGDIDHGFREGLNPPVDWKCRTEDGAAASAVNSLSVAAASGRPQADHLQNLILDEGTSTLGHRVNFLDPGLKGFAFGLAEAEGVRNIRGFLLGATGFDLATAYGTDVFDATELVNANGLNDAPAIIA